MTTNRPLSPHLQVYRWQITSVLSILHRLTGIGLAFASLLFTGWLASLAYGEHVWTCCMTLYTSFVGKILFSAILFSFFFHLCNGIRHLFWDSGVGYDMPTATKTGWLVVISSIALSALTIWRMI